MDIPVGDIAAGEKKFNWKYVLMGVAAVALLAAAGGGGGGGSDDDGGGGGGTGAITINAPPP